MIGHSHSGSVIYHALLQAERWKTELKHWKLWCTVGTPFLSYRPNRFFLQRLSTLTTCAVVVAVAAILIAVFHWINEYYSGQGELDNN